MKPIILLFTDNRSKLIFKPNLIKFPFANTEPDLSNFIWKAVRPYPDHIKI